MGKKFKHGGQTLVSPVDQEARIHKALGENRTQYALDLAKQLFKQEPTPARKELLGQVYLERARQLREQGQSKDAASVLDNVPKLGLTDPRKLSRLAEELADLGNLRRAQETLAQLPEGADQAGIQARAVDVALGKGAAGRALLPEALQPAFDLILQAFAQLEAGQDDQARATLQGIGLQSPFLEWKVFLRGLLAYYQGDDARALENWQHLDPKRLPAQLAAPVRFLIDGAFRQAQPAQVQAHLKRQADYLQGTGLLSALRRLHATLANPDNLPEAFGQASTLLSALQVEASQLVPRLASCFYWAIVHCGQPEDLNRYRRLFGEPPDDPHFHRLEALVLEHLGDLPSAHQHWQKFEDWIGGHPSAWGSGPEALAQANHARALVWCRMGHNAAGVPDVDKIPNLPPFLRDHPDRPRPLKPGAEACFRRAMELAPDLLESYQSLFQEYQDEEKDTQAIAIGRRLLERFPDHVATLEALGELYMKQQDYATSLQLFQQAWQTNPLDRTLRDKVCAAHLFLARTHAEAGQFDQARNQYQASLALDPTWSPGTVLCKWAACEFKANNATRAEELLQQAGSAKSPPLSVAFNMLIETIRLKLSAALKKRFKQEFLAGLADAPSAAAAVDLLSTAGAHRAAGFTYHGCKTHEKKVLAYLDRVPPADFTEQQLQQVCKGLFHLQALRALRKYTAQGQRRFPGNPHFFFLDAESYFLQGPNRCPIWKVRPLLDKAQELASALPPDKTRDNLLEILKARQHMVTGLGPGFLDMVQEMFMPAYPEEEDDWAEDDWAEDDEAKDFFFAPLPPPKRKKKKERRQRR